MSWVDDKPVDAGGFSGPMGWHPDPDDPSRDRWWNGRQWTESYRAREVRDDDAE